jgi:hypothetical protein
MFTNTHVFLRRVYANVRVVWVKKTHFSCLIVPNLFRGEDAGYHQINLGGKNVC